MNTQSKIIASVGIILFAATAAFAQQVKTDYDRKTDFSQYRTYSWERSRQRTRYSSTESRMRSMRPWQPKVGPWRHRAAMSQSWHWRRLRIDRLSIRSTTASAAAGGGAVDSEAQPQRSTITRSVPWLSICSMPIARTSSGGDRRATRSQTTQTRTSRNSTRVSRRCSPIFLQSRRNNAD